MGKDVLPFHVVIRSGILTWVLSARKMDGCDVTTSDLTDLTHQNTPTPVE